MLSSQLQYRTEAIFYDFDCQWTAPTSLYNESLSHTTWLVETKEGATIGVPQYFISGTFLRSNVYTNIPNI